MGSTAPSLAIVRARYNPFGGAERFVDMAIDALADRGVRTTIICGEWNSERRADGRARVIELGRPRALTRTGRDSRFEAAVREVLARERFDVVQTHERIPGIGVFRAGDGLHRQWLVQKARVQSFAHSLADRLDPYHHYTLRRERELFNHPDLRMVIANSDMVREEIRRAWPAMAHKVRVVRNGVDTRHFAPVDEAAREQARRDLGLDPYRPVMAFVGSGFERKGIGVLLQAAARLRDVHFLIVGDDKHRVRFEQHARRIGAGDTVRFVGPRQDVRPWLAAAQAFVFPTLYDPGPNAVLEAMAMGLPVVTSRTCGLAEVVAPAGAGFVHDALDVSSLTSSIDVLCDPILARDMGQAARAAALAQDSHVMSAQLLALYDELLEANRA